MKNEKAIFQVQIPAKLILFGEWAVLQGYPALGCSVGKYFNAELFAPTPENKKTAITLKSEELHFEWEDLYQKAPPFLEKTCSILTYLFEDPFILKGHTLSLVRTWKLSEGLGSSSALFLALSLLKSSRFGGEDSQLSPEDLRKRLVDFQKSGSGFDILLQACGGFLSAEINEEKTVLKKELLEIPEEILFVHTGKKMKTDVALSSFKNSTETLKDYSKTIGKSAEAFLLNKDWTKAIREHYDCLNKMGVVPAFVQELKSTWIEKKWITELKTTGAGGGDTLMLYINACKRPELEADLLTRGYWLEEAPLGVPGALESNI